MRKPVPKKAICSVVVAIAMITGWQQQYAVNPESVPSDVRAVMVSKAGNPLRFSAEAMAIMGDAEGCMANPYLCPASRLTGGIGHANDADVAEYGIPGKSPLKQIPMQVISRWFVSDMMAAQNCLEQNVEKKIGRKLSQGVFDGIGSFTLNVGCGRMMKNPKTGNRTDIYSYLLTGDHYHACMELQKYVYAAGVRLPGLVTRRGKETWLCQN